MRAGNARPIQLQGLFFLTDNALGNRLWEVQVVKGLDQSLYYKTHLLKAAKRVPTSELSEHLMSLLNLLSQCFQETNCLRYFIQSLSALILEQKSLSCLRGRHNPFWKGFPTFRRVVWGAAEATLWERLRKEELFVEISGGCLSTVSQEIS